MVKKRFPSTRVVINELVDGFVVKPEEEYEPRYLLTRDAQRIVRCMVVGVVTTVPLVKEEVPMVKFRLDDGTGTISVVVFNEMFNIARGFNRGDTVLVIGRPRDYNGVIEIEAETVNKVDPLAEIYHKALVVRKLREWREIVKEAINIYKSYGVSVHAKMTAKSKGIDPQVLSNIDRLYYLMSIDNVYEELMEEEEDDIEDISLDKLVDAD